MNKILREEKKEYCISRETRIRNKGLKMNTRNESTERESWIREARMVRRR